MFRKLDEFSCHRMYMAAPDHLKKQLNRVFFERVLVNPDTDEKGRLVLPPTDPGSDSTADAPKNSTTHPPARATIMA